MLKDSAPSAAVPKTRCCRAPGPQRSLRQQAKVHRMPQLEVLPDETRPSDAIPSHEEQPIASGVIHVDKMLRLLDGEDLVAPVSEALWALVCGSQVRLGVLLQCITAHTRAGSSCHMWLLHHFIVHLLRLHCHIGFHHTAKAHSWNASRVTKLDKEVAKSPPCSASPPCS